ncbi:MAG: hypothetical protein HKL87_08640 [Acidimicrobiaceae bacterium]|nr:hypothetical protein [Acidimicrobiaceae bacterium]
MSVTMNPVARTPPNERRLHVGLAVAELLCVSAFAVELDRALAGNTLSWIYTVEWPFLGGYAVYAWRRFLREERGGDPANPVPELDDSTQRQLDAWNAYLDEVHHGRPGDSEEPPSRN